MEMGTGTGMQRQRQQPIMIAFSSIKRGRMAKAVLRKVSAFTIAFPISVIEK